MTSDITSDIRAICNLSDEDLSVRRKELQEDLMPKARAKEALPNGVALSFPANVETREELDAFVAFERECCPGLGFNVRDTDDGLRLEIIGLDAGSSLFAGIPESSAAGSRTRGRWRMLLSSVGLGTVGALLICCVLPFGMIALLGTAVAAPLTSLDNPWIISGSALLLVALIWQWQRRREDARNAKASAGGCGC